MTSEKEPSENSQQQETSKQAAPSGPVDATNQRFMRLLGEEGGALMGIWGLLATFALGMNVLAAAIQIKTDAPLFHEILQNPQIFQQYGPSRPVEANVMVLVIYPLIWLFLTMYYGSFAAVRETDLAGGDLSFSEARKVMFARFGITAVALLGFSLITGLGMACCILPGVVASYFLSPFPYLVSARGMSLGQALSKSFEIARRHWILLLLLLGIGILTAIATMAIQAVAIITFTGVMGRMGILVGTLITWAFGCVVGYFSWLYMGSIFVTIDHAEAPARRRPPRHR